MKLNPLYLAIGLALLIGGLVWYVKFRKPATTTAVNTNFPPPPTATPPIAPGTGTVTVPMPVLTAPVITPTTAPVSTGIVGGLSASF